MTTPPQETPAATPARDLSTLPASARRTLDALFRHPLAHNLEWRDVVALVERIGEVEEKPNREVSLQVGGARHRMSKPHSKDLATTEVMELRHFLAKAGWSSDNAAAPTAAEASLDLVIVVDHHEAKIYRNGPTADEPTGPTIRPYDPHHFLHHLTHKDQSQERGQRAPEDIGFYAEIAQAVAAADRIVVIGHGAGKSNAAHHLTDYLRTHHPEIHQRIVSELVADLSSITTPQLHDLVQQALLP